MEQVRDLRLSRPSRLRAPAARGAGVGLCGARLPSCEIRWRRRLSGFGGCVLRQSDTGEVVAEEV